MSGFSSLKVYLLTKTGKAFPIMDSQGNGMSCLEKEFNWKLIMSFKIATQKPDQKNTAL